MSERARKSLIYCAIALHTIEITRTTIIEIVFKKIYQATVKTVFHHLQSIILSNNSRKKKLEK